MCIFQQKYDDDIKLIVFLIVSRFILMLETHWTKFHMDPISKKESACNVRFSRDQMLLFQQKYYNDVWIIVCLIVSRFILVLEGLKSEKVLHRLRLQKKSACYADDVIRL